MAGGGFCYCAENVMVAQPRIPTEDLLEGLAFGQGFENGL